MQRCSAVCDQLVWSLSEDGSIDLMASLCLDVESSSDVVPCWIKVGYLCKPGSWETCERVKVDAINCYYGTLVILVSVNTCEDKIDLYTYEQEKDQRVSCDGK